MDSSVTILRFMPAGKEGDIELSNLSNGGFVHSRQGQKTADSSDEGKPGRGRES